MNIVVIVIDTLRYDHIGANGNNWIRTPNMDRLAADSWVFERSYTASYPTIPHRTDVMTGRYGAPFHPWRPLRYDVLTFPQILKDAGYCTQLIHDTPHLVNGGHNFDWPFHAWTFARGAEVDRPWIDDSAEFPQNWAPDPLFDFADWDVLRDNRVIATYARANAKRRTYADWNTGRLFTTASRWLRDNTSRDNFFLWIDCFDPHEPWDVPPEFVSLYDHTPGYTGRLDPRAIVVRNDERMTKASRERVRAFYAAKVSWVDHWLGVFRSTLESTGLADNTAILFTADHGTNLAERGSFGKSYPVREHEAHTPFMVRVPGGGSGRSSIVVQPQDAFATILGIAGLPTPQHLDSHDLVAAAQRSSGGARQLALSGRGADAWPGNPEGVLCTVFESGWYLELTARPETCRLTRYGSTDDVAANNQDVVERLWEAGVDELERRGTDPALRAWLRQKGEAEFPLDCRFWDGWPGPRGFAQYFNRLYVRARGEN